MKIIVPEQILRPINSHPAIGDQACIINHLSNTNTNSLYHREWVLHG